jgi:putative endonuclease
MRDFWVYILSNNAQVLYIGVTSNLDGRLEQHLFDREASSFVARYNPDRLVYCEQFPTAREAISWEKRLKGWSREKKKRLISAANPFWKDLLAREKAGGTDPSTSSG